MATTHTGIVVSPPKAINSAQLHAALAAAGLSIDGITVNFDAAGLGTLVTVLFTSAPTPSEQTTATATVAAHVALAEPSGPVLFSRDGTRWRITVSNLGVLVPTPF